mgnify:CR=1 FL=1
MSSKHLRKWIAGSMLAGAAAGLVTAAPAQAEPLWPGGPNIPGVPALISTLPGQGAPCSPAARACMRLGTNEAWLMDNGRTVFGPTRISHGGPGFETPPGVFKVFLMKPFHWSTMHNAPMPYAMFFNGDIAFHVGPVDLPSHGCVRMQESGAKAFFDYLKVGDVVEVVR